MFDPSSEDIQPSLLCFTLCVLPGLGMGNTSRDG
jgi:hypothetical protein